MDAIGGSCDYTRDDLFFTLTSFLVKFKPRRVFGDKSTFCALVHRAGLSFLADELSSSQGGYGDPPWGGGSIFSPLALGRLSAGPGL